MGNLHLNYFQRRQLEAEHTRLEKKFPSVVERLFTAESLTTASATNPRPFDQIDGVLYGEYDDVLYKSSDKGSTWSVITTFTTGGPCQRLHKLESEVILLKEKQVLKSSGWSTGNPTWTTKIATTETNQKFIPWSIDGSNYKIIVADYAVPHTDSEGYWVSVDSGDTFTFYSKSTKFGGDDAATHHHGVAYDKVADRFWICMGDSTYKKQYFSDDDGATWSAVTSGSTIAPSSAQCTTITATENGMILGSDSGLNNGILKIYHHRSSSPVLEKIWTWPSPTTVTNGFPFRNFYDEDNEIIFTAWRSDFDTIAPMITWCNGSTGGIFYTYEGTWSADDGIRNVVALPTGEVFAWIGRSGESDQVLRFGKYTKTSTPYMPDNGNLLGGYIPGEGGVSVGPGSRGFNNTVAIGGNANSEASKSAAIGWSSVSKADSVTLGYGTTVGDTFSVAIGSEAATVARYSTAVGSGSDCIGAGGSVAVGFNSQVTSNSVAIGSDTNAAGTNSVVVGRNAACTANENIIIGQGSTSSHQRNVHIGRSIVSAGETGVIIGHGITMTGSGNNNVLVGAHITNVAGNSILIGRLAEGTGLAAVSVGFTSKAAASCVAVGNLTQALQTNSVALGANTVATQADAVAIGARDLHIQSNGVKGLLMSSPDGTLYRVTVANGGTLTVTAV